MDANREQVVESQGQADTQKIVLKVATRRPDIDCIRVSLTWGILLFHTVHGFIPDPGWYIRSRYPLGPILFPMTKVFENFMAIWNMPMFFFLSGISSYFALFKRSEQQYRDERVHRLLVPYLFSFLLLWMYSITYFGPYCEEHFATKSNESRIDNCPSIGNLSNISFASYLRKQFPEAIFSPPGQAWFLWPLFCFSQLFAHLFTLWHPSHSQVTSNGIPCCGRPICCTRPFSCVIKFFSCISCFGKPASTPEELVTSTASWIGKWWKLGLLPGAVFGSFELLFALLIYGLHFDFLYTALYFFWDPAYPLMLFFGYTITAADGVIKDSLTKGRWFYLILGLALALLVSLIQVGVIELQNAYVFVLLAFFRGLSKWLLILGIYAVTRNAVKSSNRWLQYLSSIAMPFYLIHQQLLVAILSGVLWVPYLGSFPVTLILATIASVIAAHIITKLTNFRYLFGLKPSSDSFFPGKKLRGFIPVICLAVMSAVVSSFINRSY